MEPVASEICNKIKGTFDHLRQHIERMGSVSIFLVPPLPTNKSKQALDKTSEGNFSAKKLTRSNPTVSKTSPDVLACHEIITIKDNSFTSANMNLKYDEFAQSLKTVEIDGAVQPEHNADMDDTSPDGRAKYPSPKAFTTSDVEAKVGPDTKEPQSCSRFSILDNIPLYAKIVDPSLKPSHSETQSLQILEGRISEGKDISLEKFSESDCPVTHLDYPKLTHVSENSNYELPQYMHDVSHHLLSCKSSSKEVENITKKPSLLAMPSSGMIEKGKQLIGLPTEFLKTSPDLKNPKSERHCQKNSLRRSRQQPVRYTSEEFSNVHRTKAAKTRKKKTVKITLPSLSSLAEKSLLIKFHKMARFHGCEISVDEKTVDISKMRASRSLHTTTHQQSLVQAPYSALHSQNLTKYQQDSIANLNQHYQTLSSAKRKLNTNKATDSQPDSDKSSQKNYLEILQAKLQSRGIQLEVHNKTC